MAYRIGADFAWKEIGGQVVILNSASGEYWSLNSTASVIWKGAMEGLAPGEIAARVSKEFEVTKDEAAKDVDVLLKQFVERKILG
jgi:hypothetical protein